MKNYFKLINILFTCFIQIVNKSIEYHRSFVRTMCVINSFTYPLKDYDFISKCDKSIFNNIYNRAVLGLKVGDINYIINRKSMNFLLWMIYKQGHIG
jgi:hypothetical protein